MKKKILSIILSLLLFIPCMFLFTACGEDYGVHLLYAGPESAETKDPGLFSMRVKYIPMWKADIENAENPDGEQPEGGDTEEDEEAETQQPDWINKTLSLSYRDKVSFSGGDIFFTIITLELNQGYEIGDLKVLLNGEEAELHIVQGDGMLLCYSLGYRFIEETTILTFEGQTKPIEYTFNIGLVNYDAFKDSERFSDLRFSGVIRNVPTDGTAPTVKEIFTYNDKTEFKPDEFVEALRNTPVSYFEDLVVSMYFKNRDKIIPQFSAPWTEDNPSPPYFFTELESCWYYDENTPLWAWNDELEYKLCFDRNSYNNMLGKQPRFNFSALSFLTLEEMKYVTAIGDCSFTGVMPTDIIDSLRNVEVYEQSFIVTIDGQETEVDSLAFADLRKSTNTKVKIKVPKTLARIVDSDAVVSLYTTAESNFDNINTIELNKETNFARESTSNDVNYEYIIVDIDNIKPYKTHEDTSNKIVIGFNIDPDALRSNIAELKTLKIKSTTNGNSSGLVKEVIYEETLNLYPYDYNESDDSHIYLSAENIDYKFGLSYLSSSWEYNMYSYSLTKLYLKVTKADGTKKEYLFNVCDLYNPNRGEQTRTIAPAENYSDFTFERGYYDASELLEYGDTGGYEQYNNQFIHFFSFDHTYGEIVEIEFYKEFGINSITLSQELKAVSDRVWECISFDNPATPSVLNVQRDPFPTLNTTFYNTEDPEEIKMIKLRTGEKAALIYMLGSIFERYEYSPVISDTSCDLLLNFDIETELGTHNFIISLYYDYVEYGNESLYIDVVETVNGVHQYSGIDVTYDNIQDEEPVWDYTRVYCISEDKYLGLAASPTWYGLHETTDTTSYFATTMNNRVQELLALAEDVEKIDMSFLNEYETYKSSVLALIQALNA